MSNEAELGIRLFLIDSASNGLSNFGSSLLGILLTSRGLTGAFGGTSNSLKEMQNALAGATAKSEELKVASALLTEEFVALDAEQAALHANGPMFSIADQGSIARMNIEMAKLEDEEVTLTAAQDKLNAAIATARGNQGLVASLNEELAANDAALAKNADAQAMLQLRMDTTTSQGLARQNLALAKNDDAYTANTLAIQENITAQQENNTKISTLNKGLADGTIKSQMMSVAVGGLIASAVGFIGFGSAILFAVDKSKALQDELVKVQTNVDMTGVSMANMQSVIIDLANNSTFATKDVADSFVLMGQRAFTAADIVRNDMGGAAVDLAQAISSDLGPATDLLTQAMQAFHLKASDATLAANILTNAFHHGVPDVTQLQQELNAVGSQAHSAGWSLTETSQALDLLAQSGIKGSTAGTSLRYMLSSLIDPTNKVQIALASVGIITVSTNNKFYQFMHALESSGKAGKTAAGLWDGSVKSLQEMYAAAQKIPGLAMDKTFYQWAVQTGILKDALFDAKGNFKSLDGILKVFGGHIKDLKTNQEFQAWLTELGGARSGKTFQALLQNMGYTGDKLKELMKQYNDGNIAVKDSNQNTDTLSAAMKRLGTTFNDLGATSGTGLLSPLKDLANQFNKFIGDLSNNPGASKSIGQFLLLGLAVSSLGILFFGLMGIIVLVGGAIGVVGAPVVAIIAGVIALGAAIGVFLAKGGSFAGVFNGLKQAFSSVMTFLQPFIHMIKDQIGPAVSQVGSVITSQLFPAFQQLGTALAPAIPLLKFLGSALLGFLAVVGVLLGGALIGIILGLINGIKYLLIGITYFITGFVQMWAGVFNFLHAIFTVFHGIFTGNSDMIKAGGRALVGALGQIFGGMGKMLIGIFTATFGFIFGYIAGFVQGIIGFFQHLFEVLVGHSIIPDMVNGIVRWIVQLRTLVWNHILAMVMSVLVAVGAWENQMIARVLSLVQGVVSAFASLPGKVGNFFHSLASTVMGVIMGIASSAPGWAASIVQGLINGFMGMMSNLRGAIGNIASAIMGPLAHHSPAKEGPLKDDDQWMPSMMQMHADGIMKSLPLIHKAMGHVTGALNLSPNINTPGITASRVASSYAASGGGPGGTGNITIPLYVEGRCVAKAVYNQITGDLKLNGYSRLAR